MGEAIEAPDSGPEATVSGVDPAAIALVLNSASIDPSIAADARAFLRSQSALIADQRHHLREQIKHLHLGFWEKWLGVLLRVATAVVGIAFATAIAFMVWDATQSNGLLIEHFSVPPDLASRGLTGEVVAAKLLDDLALMQAQTSSQRAAKSYAHNWGENGIKLDIPDTGISLTELDNYLREKLGHDTHVSGEIVRTASGVTITARSGGDGAESVAGPEADIDGLILRLAEAIYQLTQPYRYGIYLASHGRTPEAIPVFKALAKTSSKVDRMYGFNRWGVAVGNLEGVDAGLALEQQAVAEDPDNIGAWMNLLGYQSDKSHPEEALHAAQNVSQLLKKTQEYVASDFIPDFEKRIQAEIHDDHGAFHDAGQLRAVYARTGMPGVPAAQFASLLAADDLGEHDLSAARATLADIADAGNFFIGYTNMRLDNDVQDWAGVLSQVDGIGGNSSLSPANRSLVPSTIAPLIAYAEARLGRIAAAEAHIAATRADCYVCLRTRGKIAALRGQNARADYWFARAVQQAPSIPFAYADWGQELLARGDADGAIAKFTLANKKGPHFADALEMWGEALMAKKQAGQALTKFAEAEKYAPNWGRLHLKWGEALAEAGRNNEAQKQFALAAKLDLSAADKDELAKVSGHV